MIHIYMVADQLRKTVLSTNAPAAVLVKVDELIQTVKDIEQRKIMKLRARRQLGTNSHSGPKLGFWSGVAFTIIAEIILVWSRS